MKRAQHSLSAVKAQCLCGAVKLSCYSLIVLQRHQRGGSTSLHLLSKAAHFVVEEREKHSSLQHVELRKDPAPPIIKIISSQRQKLAEFLKEDFNGLSSEIQMYSLLAFMEYNNLGR